MGTRMLVGRAKGAAVSLGLPLSLCLLGHRRVETFTSENNELWKKVETLENANRWVVPPASPRPLRFCSQCLAMA